MAEKVNINTIAKMAGVATSTVSCFINCAETIPISEAKRERIMEAMRATKYRPSAASSSLRRNSILPGKAVFIFGGNLQLNAFNTCRNPMLGELIATLSAKMEESLFLNLEVRSVKDENNKDAWNETISDADAVVCYGRLDAPLLELSTRRNIPLVMISDHKTIQTRGMETPPHPVDCLYWDAASHLEKILNHVTGKGARRLAFVSSWNLEENNPNGGALEAEAKIEEFKKFVEAKGLSGELFTPPMPKNTSPYYEGRNAYEFLREKDLKNFDAIIGHNDFVAHGIIGALKEKGIIPGRDILVCGEGDYAELRHEIPSVTTVSYDKGSMSERICEILKSRMEDNHPQGVHQLAPSYLLERESTGGIAQ